ncbi:MAG: HAMP domain-containing sensor histidine kinase [Lachnospiraceae bacterium]|nr:HAMP domain-containing sensor histidine kinase [Lachnospiraceae bacterium]MDY5521016.1 HAMP domain-containing sensor histidine kinase [Agathobacter sp.]
MKIKTKLIISFCIIIFFPLLLAGMVTIAFCNFQVQVIEQTYGIRNADAYSIMNSVQILSRYTANDFEEIKRMAQSNPALLTGEAYLNEKNEELKQKSSYLVVRKDNEIVYNGAENNEAVLQALPEYGTTDPDTGTGIYTDSDAQILVKQIDYVSEVGEQESVFIVTSMDGSVPEIKTMVVQVIMAIFLILLVTGLMMIVWIYRSMITPLKKLQAAAENIKEGNLDFEIEAGGEDEIGELCVTFEEMRQRLKDNTEEKLNNERENKALISNIAHDLKTPITAVKGYAEGIIDGVANTPEKVDKYVRTIYNKANEMDTLINELTLYSKIDTNRIPYNFAKINVAEYFNDCVEEIGLDLESKGIGLSYYNYASPDIVIIADPEQLRRVVNNIIGNSVKYMNKQQGFIQIRIKDVGDFIQVELEDNGRGIAQKDLPYIFDRFYRTDASRNSATGGSGIGLSIVKKIVEDHGGKIWATSKEDAGTIMYFVIRKYQEVTNE